MLRRSSYSSSTTTSSFATGKLPFPLRHQHVNAVRHFGINVNLSAIAEVKFARGNGVHHTEPEAAYDALAGNLGLCGLKDFYRGAGQAYYSLATVLGGPCTDERPAVVLGNILEEKNAEWTKQQAQTQTQSSSTSDNSTSSSTQQQEKVNVSEIDTNIYTSAGFRTNTKLLNRLEVTRGENDLLSPATMFTTTASSSATEKASSSTTEENKNNESETDENTNTSDDEGEPPKKARPPPTLEGRGVEWPPAKFASASTRFVEAEGEDEILHGFKLTELADVQTGKNVKDANLIRTLLASASTSTTSKKLDSGAFSFLSIPILRSVFSPSLRNGLYQFGPWNANQVNAVAAITGNPFAPKSNATTRRLYHLIAQPDEKIDAVQVESMRIVERPETAVANAKKAEESSKKIDDAETKNNDDAEKTSEELKSPTPFQLYGSMNADVDESVKKQRRDEFFRDFEAVVTVNYLVQIPPSRYTSNYSFFRSRMKIGSTLKTFDKSGNNNKKPKPASSTTTSSSSSSSNSDASPEKLKAEADQEEHDDYLKTLQEHYDGSKEAAIAAADSASRTLAVSNVYWTFRALEFVAGKIFSMPRNVLDPRAMPHHMLSLSEAFPTQPCRYVKTVTFAYNHALEHWRVTNVQLNGHFMQDFDMKEWKALNGGTIY